MLVHRLTTLDETDNLRTRWNELAGEIPFRRWEWLATWWRHFCDRGELYLLRVTNPAGEVVGIAPWLIEHSALSGRTVQPLGSGETCSDYLGVLTDPAWESEVTDALSEWLVDANQSGSKNGWDRLQFDGLAGDDRVFLGLLEKLERRECTVHRQPGLNCWRIPLPATWEGYLQQLPKPQRKRMRQARQTLHPDGEFRVQRAIDANNWNKVWNAFVELHQLRRTSLGQPGCFGNPKFAAFLQEAAKGFLEQGHLRIVLVERGTHPVAAILMFTGGSVCYAYQMGTNPEYLADSPGWLVICESVIAGIEQHETGLDLLRGDEPYKSRMGAVPRDMLEVRVVPPQLTAQLRHSAWLTGNALKSWIKSSLHAAGVAPNSSPSGSN